MPNEALLDVAITYRMPGEELRPRASFRPDVSLITLISWAFQPRKLIFCGQALHLYS